MQSAENRHMTADPEAAETQVKSAQAGMSRSERLGRRWRVSDDALWNPFEVISFILWIIFGFGFLLGHGHYVFMAELFAPVIAIGLVVVLVQAVLRRRAGQENVLRVLRNRIG